MTPQAGERHLARDSLLEYLAGAPAAIPITGAREAFLLVDPTAGRLALRVARGGEDPPNAVPYRHFAAAAVSWRGASWLELSFADRDALIDAYPVLCAVADRVQLEGATFTSAVVDALATYRELLAGVGRMSEEEETGLYGELLVLAHLLLSLGPADALSAWQGPRSEEHDFVLSDAAVEVKATRSETRRHWIGDLAQLVPTPNRPLWLVSLQLTAAGPGGLTLAGLIDEIRSSLPDENAVRTFDARLGEARWREDQAAMYQSPLQLRSAPAVFRVDASFPAITPAALVRAGIPVARFPKVTYLVDLTGIDSDVEPPAVIAGLSNAEAGP
ncbi:MAG: hypothetical protein QOK43_1840 [Acidimicrobiaceae bacterium]|nr:hypothetical protein [Acidimicrobiaceae bacterium]